MMIVGEIAEALDWILRVDNWVEGSLNSSYSQIYST